MPLLQASDFDSGYYYLPVDKYNQLQGFIDHFNEDAILGELLGEATYTLYKADLDANNIPQTAPWTDIFNAFCKEVDPYQCRCNGLDYTDRDLNINGKVLVKSIGIKDMMKGFVYYHYLVNLPYMKTPTGNKFMLSANSEPISDHQNNSDAESRYNKSVMTYQSIQSYICDQKADGVVEFKDFSGFEKHVKFAGIL